MLESIWAGFVRQVRLLFVLASVTTVVGVSWSLLTGGEQEASGASAGSDAVRPAPAWGESMLAGLQEHVVAGLPVRVANACGLGASSCFRCHNGKRAEAPGSDPAADPWHVQHKTVNNSCAGCHQGNPRLMKQSIAHRDLVADPTTKPAETCQGCHTSDETGPLVETYQKLTKTTGE